MIRFLCRWGLRLGVPVVLLAGSASSSLVNGLLAVALLGYFIWSARPVIGRDVRRLWVATSFRRRGPVRRLGRLRGDTL